MAAAVDLDLRYQTVYGYVQNDVTKKRPTVDLALQLFCASFGDRIARYPVFDPAAPLFRDNLLDLVDDPQDRHPPLPARYLRASRAAIDFLLGQPRLDEALRPFCSLVPRSAPDAPSSTSIRCTRRASSSTSSSIPVRK